jgi:hypothetical protein
MISDHRRLFQQHRPAADITHLEQKDRLAAVSSEFNFFLARAVEGAASASYAACYGPLS